MKNIFLMIILVGGVAFSACNSNSDKKPITTDQNIFGGSDNALTELQKDIVKKFRDGNVSGLSEYFGEEVSITILKESDFFTKEEAEEVMFEFCKNNAAKQFFVKHHGTNADKTSYYIIGELTTLDDKKFRTYISNNDTKIENIEITIPTDM